MKNIFQSLLLVIAGATQKELARQVKYLKVENQILRSIAFLITTWKRYAKI